MSYKIWENGHIIEWMRIYCDVLVISKWIVMLFNWAEFLEH